MKQYSLMFQKLELFSIQITQLLFRVLKRDAFLINPNGKQNC